MANRPASNYPDIGALGEDIVSQWLQSTGWIILHRRWRCRWGELDVVAILEGESGRGGEWERGRWGEKTIQNPKSIIQNLKSNYPLPNHSPLLAFVEVKTRSKGNWDAGGLLAITPQKQAKLRLAARCFLAAYPDFADYACRFDVALVSYQKLAKHQQSQSPQTSFSDIEATDLSSLSIQLGQTINFAGYQLVLQEYLPSAFD